MINDTLIIIMINDTLVIRMINNTLDHKEVVKFFSGEINLWGYTLGL